MSDRRTSARCSERWKGLVMSRFVRPESDKLDLSHGDWVLVKRRLTAGEQRRAFARTVKRMQVGEATQLDPEAIGLSVMVVYLLDWSLTDDSGQVVLIRDQPESAVESALLQLDPDSFREISDAIDAHVQAQQIERENEKKVQDGAPRFPQISRSAG